MIGGLVALAFNPSFWMAIAFTVTVSFSGGFFKGWNASNADHWRAQVTELHRAAAQKEAIIKADAKRAEADQSEIERWKAVAESIAHESRLAPGSCKLSESELGKLHRLAAGNR
jgi:hypothetical protein